MCSLTFQRICGSKGGRTAHWLGSTEMPGATFCSPREPVLPRHATSNRPHMPAPRELPPQPHEPTLHTHELPSTLGSCWVRSTHRPGHDSRRQCGRTPAGPALAAHGLARLTPPTHWFCIFCSCLPCCGYAFKCSPLPVLVSLLKADNLSVGAYTDSGICFFSFGWLVFG